MVTLLKWLQPSYDTKSSDGDSVNNDKASSQNEDCLMISSARQQDTFTEEDGGVCKAVVRVSTGLFPTDDGGEQVRQCTLKLDFNSRTLIFREVSGSRNRQVIPFRALSDAQIDLFDADHGLKNAIKLTTIPD